MTVAYVALFTSAELDARYSAPFVRAVLDDDRNGTSDSAVLTQLIEDSSSYVLERYAAVTEQAVDANAIPKSLRRLALDVAGAYMAQRDPDRARVDPEAVFTRVRKEIADMRQAVSVIVATPPDPTANNGGDVFSSDPEATALPAFWSLNGTGIF